MKKNEEFKVMPWLRSIREKHAREIEGMSPAEILAESRKRKKVKPPLYVEVNSREEIPLHSVAEKKTKYGRQRKDEI